MTTSFFSWDTIASDNFREFREGLEGQKQIINHLAKHETTRILNAEKHVGIFAPALMREISRPRPKGPCGLQRVPISVQTADAQYINDSDNQRSCE